jgi:hypothetical protein
LIVFLPFGIFSRDKQFRAFQVTPVIFAEDSIQSRVSSFEDPDDRLRAIIRLQAETGDAQDEYLTSLLSEEATRSAILELIRQKTLDPADAPNLSQNAVDEYVRNVAWVLGLAQQWAAGQQLIRDVKDAERDRVTKALTRYLKPAVDLD